jgi:YD repeat-containing protein
MCDAAGWEAWSYDSRGHVITERRNTNSVTKSTAYTYNFHGRVRSITYPSGRTVSYTYNAAGQTLSADRADSTDSEVRMGLLKFPFLCSDRTDAGIGFR